METVANVLATTFLIECAAFVVAYIVYYGAFPLVGAPKMLWIEKTISGIGRLLAATGCLCGAHAAVWFFTYLISTIWSF